MFVEAKDIAQVFGGTKALGTQVKELSDLERLVREGLPMAAVENAFRLVRPTASDSELHVLVHVVFKQNESKHFARLKNILRLPSSKTKKSKSSLDVKLQTSESERAERLARVYALARFALGDDELAGEFMFKPHPMLEKKTPLEKLATEIGAHQVEVLLNRAIHGIAA
jgi:putative toxin-antitoxin system antitoxin component (TIGR02293 family)